MRAIYAFIAVQLRIGAALSNAAEARFKAWARPRTDAVHTVTHVPDSDEARLRRYATAAFADDLVTTNAANLACRAARLLCNGEKSSGARIVKTGDVLTLARPPERRTLLPDDEEKRDAWISKRERLLAALRDETRHAPPLQVLYEDDAMAVVLKPAGVHAMSWRNTLKRRQLCLDDVLPLTRSAHVALGRAFEQNEVDKEYGALVVGAVASGTVDAPIDGLASTTVVTARGQTPCAVDGVLTDVALKPVTGRRHQLRRHCGERSARLSSATSLIWGPAQGIGLFLYCRRLALAHPLAPGRLVSCEIDEPRRFGRHRVKAQKGWDWARDHGEL
ncbi:unnamed protein product [Pelagomonas calceolata]|uniref:Pseudouridine synthase RsuA/RluA-like domain-containing protein n=1 Tax=Pelagomonas calceolata TaxID=35677 RepID=A0A8J2SWA0_9STRA|nr:unnamed protein product [Pelagomonas calceolata]